MSIVAESYRYVMGVDTHAAVHSYVIVAAATGARVAGPQKFPTTDAGMARALAWCRRSTGGESVLAAVEGSASYGRRLARTLDAAQIPVTEVRPPRRGGPKSDALDAEGTARLVLGRDTANLTQLRATGLREALALTVTARRALTKDVTANTERLITLARRFELGVDARHGLNKTTIATIARWRTRSGDRVEIGAARAEATRLARRITAADQDLVDNGKRLTAMVKEIAPTLLEQVGVGPVCAATILASYSHKGRLRTEAAFAMHAGVAPIPTGSGRTDGQTRLNSSNDRHLNSAIYTITLTRMRCYEPTRNYVTKRAATNTPSGKVRRAVQRYVTRDLYRCLEALDIAPTA